MVHSADSRSGSDFRVYKKAHFTLGVRAYVQPKSSIPIGATVEISPKAEIEKIFSICPPKSLINAEFFWLPIGPKAEEKDTTEFGKPICNNPWGHYLSIY
jgi:hypothetical protein